MPFPSEQPLGFMALEPTRKRLGCSFPGWEAKSSVHRGISPEREKAQTADGWFLGGQTVVCKYSHRQSAPFHTPY